MYSKFTHLYNEVVTEIIALSVITFRVSAYYFISLNEKLDPSC